MADGWTAEEVFKGGQGLSLDEVVFLPGPGSSASFAVDLSTKITRNLELRWPLVSGPRDTVTEANMAIAMALEGGVGIIHGNQSIEEQVAMVRKVKNYATGFILQCETLKPWNTVGDAIKLQADRDCSCIPITDNGRVGGKLMGIVTRRDLEAVEEKDMSTPIKAVMQKDMLYIHEPVAIKKARAVMAKSKVSKLPVVNEDKELVALICRGDLKREWDKPNASRDANRSLLVSAAINASESDAWDRMEALVQAGIDFICLDTDEGVFPDTIHFIKRVKDRHEGIDILAGSVWSAHQAKALLDAGVDGLRVGLCEKSEASALFEICRMARNAPYEVPVLADVQAKDMSNVLKALCLGACTATLDGVLRGAEEAPGDHFFFEGVRMRLSHGYKGGTEQLVPLGTQCAAVVRGTVASLLARTLEGLRMGFRELEVGGVGDVPGALATGNLRLERQLRRDCPEALDHPPLHRVAVSTLHCRW